MKNLRGALWVIRFDEYAHAFEGCPWLRVMGFLFCTEKCIERHVAEERIPDLRGLI